MTPPAGNDKGDKEIDHSHEQMAKDTEGNRNTSYDAIINAEVDKLIAESRVNIACDEVFAEYAKKHPKLSLRSQERPEASQGLWEASLQRSRGVINHQAGEKERRNDTQTVNTSSTNLLKRNKPGPNILPKGGPSTGS